MSPAELETMTGLTCTPLGDGQERIDGKSAEREIGRKKETRQIGGKR
jgi:hypothetical protein